MKKAIIAVLALISAVAYSADAQTKAFGARLGVNTIEASYLNILSSDTFLEANAGLDTYCGKIGLIAEAAINYSVFKPSFTASGEWDVFAGLGLAAGYVYDNSLSTFTYRDPYYGNRYTVNDRWGMGPMAGVSAQIGISYTFESLPLRITLDARPIVGLHFAERIHPDSDKNGRLGLYGAGIRFCYPRLSVHYILF